MRKCNSGESDFVCGEKNKTLVSYISICFLLQLLKTSATCAEGACRGRYHPRGCTWGLEGCVRSLTQGLPAGVKSGASWMPSGCPLGEEPAPHLARVPADLVIVPCCHTAQIFSKPNASVSLKSSKLAVK